MLAEQDVKVERVGQLVFAKGDNVLGDCVEVGAGEGAGEGVGRRLSAEIGAGGLQERLKNPARLSWCEAAESQQFGGDVEEGDGVAGGEDGGGVVKRLVACLDGKTLSAEGARDSARDGDGRPVAFDAEESAA